VVRAPNSYSSSSSVGGSISSGRPPGVAHELRVCIGGVLRSITQGGKACWRAVHCKQPNARQPLSSCWVKRNLMCAAAD
jgi:hypothetical protein